jgi:hypothetical protein
MNGLSLFIEKGFKIEKQSKFIDGQKKVNYLIDSPKFGKFEVDSLQELTREKYETLKNQIVK